jgi:outer membrane protein OmpA-like peptidoglycan-associated protein
MLPFVASFFQASATSGFPLLCPRFGQHNTRVHRRSYPLVLAISVRFISLLMLAWLPMLGFAQTLAPVGDGLRGDYYDGLNFEHFIQARRDARLDFSWQERGPVSGVPANYFAVRWTGWLVPPVTGRYVLHLAVDDGARLWLGNRQLLDEWRGQPLGYYQAEVELQAGHAYRLRLDYCQYSSASRVLLSWERPQQPEALDSWHNLWGLATAKSSNHYREVVPTRYLFSGLPVAPRPAPAALPPVVAVPAAKPVVKPTRLPAQVVVGPPHVRVASRSLPPARAIVEASRSEVSTKRVTSSPADTLGARLASGSAVTWRALYFAQGQADLLPPVRANLDTLVRVLTRYPSLRLEVQGHTDNQGDSALNRQLSRRRAEVVCQYLAMRGIAAGRLRPVGLGGTQPVADNRQPAERPHNRRVVLRPWP